MMHAVQKSLSMRTAALQRAWAVHPACLARQHCAVSRLCSTCPACKSRPPSQVASRSSRTASSSLLLCMATKLPSETRQELPSVPASLADYMSDP